MFFIIMLYAVIGGMCLLGTLSLITGGSRYVLLNIMYGTAQIVLFLSVTIIKGIL